MLLSNLNLLATAPSGVARLRELILTLAVQGKLVPQDPKDEPASELLKKIRAEKDRLIAAGKVKRDKPVAEIAEEEKPFGLPVGWEWVPLQYIGYTQTGTTPDKKSPDFYGTYLPFIKPGDIYPGYVDYDNEALSERGLQDSGRVAPAGSVLMVCIGTIGKTNTIDRDCSFNQQINSITPLCCSPAFVSLYLRCPEFQSQAWTRSASTTISILNKGNWEQIPVALPPLLEQSRIVTRVEELMCLCDALEAKAHLETTQHAQLVTTLLSSLTTSTTPQELSANWQRVATHFDLLLDRPEAVDALEQTILQLAVRGLLVPQDRQDEPASTLLQKIHAEKDKLIAQGKIKRDKPLPPIAEDEQPFALPQGWEFARMGHLIELVSGQHLGPNEYVEGLGASVPYLTGPAEFGLVSPEPSRSTNERRAIAIQADILITVKGSGVGKLNVVSHSEIAISRQLMAIRPVKLDSEFLIFVLQTMALHFQEKSVGIAIPGIGRDDVMHTLIGLPPLAEQSRIVTRVTQLRQLCAELRTRLATSQSTQAQLAEALVDSVGSGVPVVT